MKFIKNIISMALAVIAVLPSVMAEPLKIGAFLTNILSYIFVDFTKLGADQISVWMRLLLFLFWYAVLYWAASRKLFREHGRRISQITALTISLISVLAIPTRVLASIAQTFGVIIGIFLTMALPIVGLIFLLYKTFPTTERIRDANGNEVLNPRLRLNHIIWMIAFYLLATIIHNFGAAIAGSSSTIFANPQGWHDWAGLAESVCLLMMLWHLIAAIFFASPEGEAGNEVRGAEGRGAEGNWLNNLLRNVPHMRGAGRAEAGRRENQPRREAPAQAQQRANLMRLDESLAEMHNITQQMYDALTNNMTISNNILEEHNRGTEPTQAHLDGVRMILRRFDQLAQRFEQIHAQLIANPLFHIMDLRHINQYLDTLQRYQEKIIREREYEWALGVAWVNHEMPPAVNPGVR